mmetsp:Transcript_19855/g.42315  ORF Transcript_19855/g.42315 Transcript_19855/m.42315 type:complete len:116 (-) Transcript_19855:706-1053(-)
MRHHIPAFATCLWGFGMSKWKLGFGIDAAGPLSASKSSMCVLALCSLVAVPKLHCGADLAVETTCFPSELISRAEFTTTPTSGSPPPMREEVPKLNDGMLGLAETGCAPKPPGTT